MTESRTLHLDMNESLRDPNDPEQTSATSQQHIYQKKKLYIKGKRSVHQWKETCTHMNESHRDPNGSEQTSVSL